MMKPKKLGELMKGLKTIVAPMFIGMILGYFISERQKDSKAYGKLVIDKTGSTPEIYLDIDKENLDSIDKKRRIMLKVKKVRK